jgi:hypothetical protein
MRAKLALFSAIHFFGVVTLMAAGAFLIALPQSPHLRVLFSLAVARHAHFFILMGSMALAISGILILAFYVFYPRRYYQVKMRTSQVEVDVELIRRYAQEYGKSLFPEQEVSIDLFLSATQKIELFIQMPPSTSFPQQKVILSKIEKELGSLLATKLGYDRDLLVTVEIK